MYQISWDFVEETTKTLVEKIKEHLAAKNIDVKNVRLIIPCRGGEIIGSLVKNSLKLQESQVARIKFSNSLYIDGVPNISVPQEYDRETFVGVLLDSSKNKDLHYIFVDDLVDSGLTIDFIKSRIENLSTYVLCSKEGKNTDKVTHCVSNLPDEWIVFPWENVYSD